MNILQRRRQDLNSLEGMVRAGYARAVNPTTDTGHRSYGQGRLILPTTVNLIPDPQGTLADGTFWPASTANTTITANFAVPTPIAGYPHVFKCLRFVNDGTADTPATATIAVSASTTYWTHIFVYAPTLGGNLTITAENGHTFTVAALTAANTGWVHYRVKSATVAGETTLHLHCAFAGGTTSTVYVTEAMVEYVAAIPTPPFDGSADGCTWSSTAHASSSTRVQTFIEEPLLVNGTACVGPSGTIAVRFVSGMNANDSATWQLLSLTRSYGANEYVQLAKRWDNTWTGYVFDSGGAAATIASTALTFAAGTTHVLILRWTPTTLDLKYDGTDAGQVAHTKTAAPITPVCIGRTAGAGGFCCGEISDLILSPAAEDATWATGVATALTAGESPTAIFRNYVRGRAGRVIYPLQSDSVGYAAAD